MTDSIPSGATRSETWALKVFAGFTLFALGGYATFGRHPEWLEGLGPLQAFYGIAFPLLARAHIVVAAGVLALLLVGRVGWRWVVPALAAVGLSLAAELVGTGTGMPFGAYRYSGLLGWKVAGHVPMLVPVSWCLMALPAFALAHRVFPGGEGAVGRISLAALGLVAWDLALDPAMSRLVPYWIWDQAGPYYGMPWINLFGWMVTGLLIMTAFQLLGVARWVERLPARWLAAYYLITLAMPLGMVAVAGLWAAVVATLLAVAGLWAVGKLLARGASGALAQVA